MHPVVDLLVCQPVDPASWCTGGMPASVTMCSDTCRVYACVATSANAMADVNVNVNILHLQMHGRTLQFVYRQFVCSEVSRVLVHR